MIEIVVVWFMLGFLLFGILAFYFILMKKRALEPWRLRTSKDFVPKLSIIVPTRNESYVIRFKLENLAKVEYPKELIQAIIVDSGSEDGTVEIVKNFAEQHPDINIMVLLDHQRKGKSAALNLALRHCHGDVVVVSDADCFWPPDILCRTLRFLADPSVGGISGVKVLLNPKQSWVTKSEDFYLNSMNLMRLGESKWGFTPFFEGGFSVYKKEALKSFDPYNTGSDDCGTVIGLAETGYKAIMVPEGKFYSIFPSGVMERLSVKLRRGNQLVRVLWKYIALLFKGRVRISKRVVALAILTYFIGPILFAGFMIITILMLLSFPSFAFIFLIFLIPKVRFYLFEVMQSYFLMFISMLGVALGKKFVIWRKPKDRVLLREDTLRQYGLI